MKIGKTFRFEAAHQLEGWPTSHQCSRMHGHSYKVDVIISGNVQADGAVLDFAIISDVWRNWIFPIVDHHDLNDVLKMENTTAENIAIWMYQKFTKYIDTAQVKVHGLRVWETETSYAEVTSSGT